MSNNLNLNFIYICHYNKLIERKKSISQQLSKYNLTNYIFVEHFDKEFLLKDEVKKIYPNIEIANMTLGEKSLALKHSWIVNDAYVNKYESILVLEDDAILCDDFVNKFNQDKEQLPNDWDIGWIGSCFHLNEPYIDGINVYPTKRGSRCTHAFCLSRKFMTNMHKEFFNINQPSDCFYNYIIKNFNIENYWFQPPLAFQSLDFCSSLNADPNHKWNPAHMG